MKKTVLLLLTLCLSVAAHADFVTVEQAREKAATFLTQHSKSRKQIKASALRSVNTSARKSPALLSSSRPCYYIFNSPDSTGFVIVSAESSTVEILAYSNEGYFHTDDIDKGAEVFLNQYTRDIEQVRSNGLTAEQKAYVRKASAASSDGEVLLTTANFGQHEGYWNSKYSPLKNENESAPSGCVATAAAIIMHYHKWPLAGKGSNSYVLTSNNPSLKDLSLSRDFSQDTYNWECIPNTSSYDEDSGWTDEAKDEIGKILLACGISCYMVYGYGGSAADERYMLRAMADNFSYAVDYKNYYKQTKDSPISEDAWESARSSIDNNMPVMVSTNSHCFVLDGYNGSYYHYNLGWGGWSNGWYVNGSITGDNYELVGIHTDIQPQTGRITVTGETGGGLTYSMNDAGVLNISGTGSVPKMSEYIEMDNIRQCNIAEGVSGLDYRALEDCDMTKVTIPSTLTKSGEEPFAYCRNLATIEVSPSNPVFSSPNNNCFYNKSTCTLIKYNTVDSVIVFPEGVKRIGNWALEFTPATSVDFPYGVDTIGIVAFCGADNLREVHIPSTVVRIASCAFSLKAIRKFTCDAMYPPSIDPYAFSDSVAGATLYVPAEALDRYRDADTWNKFGTIDAIPGSETWENTARLQFDLTSAGTLSQMVPADCSSIREIVISGDINADDIGAIREIASDSSTRLSVIDMKDAHLVKGGSYVYNKENNYTATINEDGEVPKYMLRGFKLDKLILPSQTKILSAYFLPDGIQHIDLPEGLRKIGDNAFFNSTSLRSLTIPASVEEIGERVVTASWYLEHLEVDPANTHYKSVDNIIYSIDGKIAVASIVLDCEEVVVPEGVEQIYAGAYGYGRYKTITVPPTVTSIGQGAFTSYNLEVINCLATTPPVLDYQLVFSSNKPNITVYVPEASAEAYRSAPVWSDLNIVGADLTGIGTITPDSESTASQRIYTITGIPVPADQSLRPGLYIKGGKKILVK